MTGTQQTLKKNKLAKSDQATMLFRALINSSLIALVLAVVMLLLAIPGEAARQVDNSRFFDSTHQLGFALKPGEAENLRTIGAERLIKLGNNQLEVLNVSGGVEYRVVTDLKDPVVLPCGDKALVYDREGLYYCLLGRGGIIFEGRTEWPLQAAVFGHKGCLALLQNTPDSRGSLLVLDASGQRLFRWTSRRSLNSGYPINVTFGPGDKHINISLLNADGTFIRPIIKRLSLSESNLGEELLNLQPDLRRPLLLLTTAEDGSLWLCDGKRVYLYDDKTTQLRSLYEFDRVTSMTAYGRGVAVVAATAGTELNLYCLTGDPAEQEQFITLGTEVGPPKVSGKYLTVLLDRAVVRVAAGDLSHPHQLELSAPAVDQGVSAAGAILVVTTDYVLRPER